MKKNTVALYDPYLDVMGGGERHILSILQIFQQYGYEVTIFWDKDVSDEIKSKLNIDIPLKFTPNIFKTKMTFEKQDILRKYNTFFYVTDGSYFFTSSKRNFVFCMVPKRDLYRMHWFNKIKTLNYRFISNSQYTKYWLDKWGVKSEVIYPYISNDFFQFLSGKQKQKIILSVGRFFPHLHSKRHDVAIKWFKELQEKGNFKNHRLIIAGNLKVEDNEYFHTLKKMVGNDESIELKTNISYSEILNLYRKAKYYWHMAGIGVDENRHPEQVEHLGITPLEAMASGCIVFGYQAGGLREVIRPYNNGFLYTEQEELYKLMKEIEENPYKQREIQENAMQYVRDNFSYTKFEERVVEALM